ncbi:MAG: sulfur oxidation c-type cytochrome SoxA [Thiohalomonadaceae bacterium]
MNVSPTTWLKRASWALPVVLAVASTAHAAPGQLPEEVFDGLVETSPHKNYLSQSQQNRMMMPDNPAWYVVEDGEKLFNEPRGPKNVPMSKCDFGKGPGVLDGAYVELPRYFADTGKVMDLDSRLEHCMKTLQGYTDADPAVKQKNGSNSDVMKLQAYIASKSGGYAWNPPMEHPLEKAMRNAGEVMFYRRSSVMDFACATCHSQPDKRIRASYLPSITVPEEWTKAISWPAYRVGHDNVRSSQHRLTGCFWQMRYPHAKNGSDATIALLSFWTDAARGQPAILPDMKR